MHKKSPAALTSALTTAIVASAVALAGCAADGPEAGAGTGATPSASSSASPSAPPTESASAPEYSPAETEAIEKAEAAVLRFYETRNAVYGDPENAGPTPFADVAIDPVRSSELGVLGYFVKEGLRQTGATTIEFSGVRSVKTKSNPDKFVYPEVYLDVCVDISGTDVVDSSGKSARGEGDERPHAVIGAYEEPGEGWFVEYLEHQTEGDACGH